MWIKIKLTDPSRNYVITTQHPNYSGIPVIMGEGEVLNSDLARIKITDFNMKEPKYGGWWICPVCKKTVPNGQLCDCNEEGEHPCDLYYDENLKRLHGEIKSLRHEIKKIKRDIKT